MKGKDCLGGDIHSRSVERFKHNVGRLFTVSFGIERSFSEENKVVH